MDRFLGSVGEVILSTRQLRTAADRLPKSVQIETEFDRVERHVAELQRRVLDLRTAPLVRVMEPLPRAARQVAERAEKRVEVELIGAELELDRSILDRLGDPLLHLVRNAVDHGIEAPAARSEAGKPGVGKLWIEARREKDAIHIEVRDDGKGIDLARVLERAVDSGLVHADLAEDLPADEIALLVFHPGLSTAQSVSEISGRGVGMDAVRATVESLGGSVEVRTQAGQGTATTLIVPITAAVQRVLLVGLGNERVALPIGKVERILEVPASDIESSGGESFALIDDEPMPVIEMAGRLDMGKAPSGDVRFLVVADVRGERLALEVGRFVGQQEIYVKPVPDLLAGVKALSGLTVMGDGSPVFLLDPNQLV